MLRDLRLLAPFVRRYRWTYLAGSLCILGSIGVKLLIPRFLGDAFDQLRGLEESGAVMDPESTSGLITQAALSVVISAAAIFFIRTASRILILGTCRRAVHDLRTNLFDQLLLLPPSYYVRTPTGQVMSRSVNDVTYVQSLLGPVFMYLSETFVLYTMCLIVMGGISPFLTFVSVAPFPLFIFMARRQAAKVQAGSRAAQEKLGDISAKVDESLSGHAVIQSLTLEDYDLERFRKKCEDYRDLNLKVTWARGTLMPMMIGLASLSILLMLIFAVPMVVDGSLRLGQLIQMNLYLAMMAAPTGALGFVLSSLHRGAAALGRLREIFDAELTLRDPEDPSGDSIDRAAIRVEGLSVAYPALEGHSEMRRVLDDISFEVPAGTTLGVVGHTGSGKSTLVAALARQLEVEDGTIFIDGADVVRMPLDEVRGKVGLVPQESFLFSRSLAANIALGNPDATEDMVQEAAEIAQLSQDLSQLPEGFETQVGERGVSLSGGQRQRAALARAALLRPRILILDDTLSAVDADTAEAILARLKPLMAERTTIIVAHRVATVQHADQIIVLEEGRIVERGRHAELLSKGGVYAALHKQQRLTEERNAQIGLGGEDGP